MHEPTTFTEPASGSLRTDTVVQPRLVLVATTFLVLGFLLELARTSTRRLLVPTLT